MEKRTSFLCDAHLHESKMPCFEPEHRYHVVQKTNDVL